MNGTEHESNGWIEPAKTPLGEYRFNTLRVGKAHSAYIDPRNLCGVGKWNLRTEPASQITCLYTYTEKVDSVLIGDY